MRLTTSAIELLIAKHARQIGLSNLFNKSGYVSHD